MPAPFHRFLSDVWIWLLISGVILLLGYLIFQFISIYNLFIIDLNTAEAFYGQIRIAMKKRFDLIEQLLFVVKGYSGFERDTMISISALRSGVRTTSPEGIDDIDIKSQLVLRKIIGVIENYPYLKTYSIVNILTNSIQNIEHEVANHRYEYNKIIKIYNTKVDTIPTNFIALLVGFKKMGYLEFNNDILNPSRIKF